MGAVEAPTTEDPDAGPRVPAVRHAVALLRRIAQNPRPVAAGALSRALGIPRSSTYQILQVLIDEGLIVHLPETRAYTLGPSVFELGSAYLRHTTLEHLAGPILTRLARQIGETAQLAILHGNSILYLLKEQPARPTALVTEVGVRLPAHLTASGRSILACLPQRELLAYYAHTDDFIQLTGSGPKSLRELRQVLAEDLQRGWALENGSVSDGISCIGAAAKDPSGHPVASVVVSFRTDRHRTDLETVAGEVLKATAELTRRLGGGPAAS